MWCDVMWCVGCGSWRRWFTCVRKWTPWIHTRPTGWSDFDAFDSCTSDCRQNVQSQMHRPFTHWRQPLEATSQISSSDTITIVSCTVQCSGLHCQFACLGLHSTELSQSQMPVSGTNCWPTSRLHRALNEFSAVMQDSSFSCSFPVFVYYLRSDFFIIIRLLVRFYYLFAHLFPVWVHSI